MKKPNKTTAEAIQQLESLARCKPKSANRREHRMTSAALQHMPHDLRNILMACHLEKRSHAEIGRKFGVGEDVIASLYKEALRRFASIMVAVHAGRIAYDICPGDTGVAVDGKPVKSSRHRKPRRAKK